MVPGMQKVKWTWIPLVPFLASALALGGAYVAEYGFGLRPCVLCLYQRIPYATAMALSLTALLIWRKRNVLLPLLALCGLAFSIGGFIAVYHVGVEQKLWRGTEHCGDSGAPPSSIEELREQILKAPVVRCDEPAFVFLGLSMAGWNLLYSLALMAGCYILYRRFSRGSEKT